MTRSSGLVSDLKKKTPDRSLTCAMRICSLWHRQGVSLLAARHHVTSDLREDYTSRGKEVKKSNTALIWFPHSTDGPAERPVLPLCGCCEWRDGEGTGGCAGRSIIAAEVYISIRMQTMWVPMCPTMRLALTGRGGLCDGERNYMLPERDATEREKCWEKTWYSSPLLWTSDYDWAICYPVH